MARGEDVEKVGVVLNLCSYFSSKTMQSLAKEKIIEAGD